jgi:Saxitoxin biosynthesis operon protein SxtJ
MMMSEAEKIKAQLVIVTGLVVLYFIFKSPYFLYAAAGIGVLSVLFPIFGDYIVKGWYKLAEWLGWFNSRVLFSVLFFVFLWPIAFLSKLGKKNMLQIKRTDDKSVFFERNHTYSKKDLDQVF